jgi:diguanylate cyclase
VRSSWAASGASVAESPGATTCPGTFARAWAKAVSGTSYLPMTQAQLETLLHRLTGQLAGALLTEPFDLRAGHRVGAELVAAHIASAEGLGRTVEVIQLRLIRDLGLVAEEVEDRLARLLAAVATGYARALRDRTLDEQESIRRAAMMARTQAERALRASEARFRHQATHDPLTGLPNRAELHTRLDAALSRERATGRPSVVLLFCDLNGFKAINDRLGHRAGDQLLTEVGARIRAGLRAGDTLARYGGDEFLVLCEDDDPDQAGERLTAHVHRALAEPFRLAGEPVTIGASVGAVRSAGRAGADELISRADQAMYRAKQPARSRT